MNILNPKLRLFVMGIALVWSVSAIQAQSGGLASADTALLDGDYPTAISQYTAAAAADPSLKCDALYGLGVAQFRSGNVQAADDALTQNLSACDPTFETLVMRGQARQALTNNDGALADYQQALTLKPGLLDSYLYERMAALAPDQSVNYLRLATQAGREPESQFALREKLAQIYVLIGSPTSALAEYDTLLNEINTYLETLSHVEGAGFDKNGILRARIEAAAAQIDIDSGQTDEGYTRLQRIVNTYEETPSALPALIELVQDNQSVDILHRMRINVYNQNYNPVVAVLTDYLPTTQSAPAELYLLLGKAQRGLGDTDSAQATFATMRQKFPNDPLASAATYEQGNTYFITGDYDKAIAAYKEVVSTYPNAPETPQALLDAAETERDHGDMTRALDLYAQLGQQYATSDQAQTGLLEAGLMIRTTDPQRAADLFAKMNSAQGFLWQGKVLQASGNADAARQAWAQAANADPGDFFSIRACELINGQTPLSSEAITSTSSPDPTADKAAAEQWVSQTFNIPNVSADLSPELANDPALQRGAELWKVGLWSDARDEFNTLHTLHRNDPVGLLQLAYYYQSIGVYRSSLLAATRLAYSANQPLTHVPDAILRLAFPVDFADLIVPMSQQYNLDPLLVAALVRQESSFDPTVDSVADARGLMQFVPSTAQDVANRLNMSDYKLDDLYRPIISVTLGTYYLSSIRDYQDGSNAGALLSYNAGPGTAQAWLAQAGSDLETLYEVIGYQESKDYLDFIYSNHYIYQHLYTAKTNDCWAGSA